MKRRDEVAVGVLVTIAVAIAIVGSLWIARGGLSSSYSLYTRFPWGQNLKKGQPVLLAGVAVGYVNDVELARSGHLDVTLQINDGYEIPKGSTATVKPVGIFGDVAVGIDPPKPVPAANYAPGDTLPPGIPAADIGQIMNRVDSIGESVQHLTRALDVQVVQAGTLNDIHKTIANAAALSAELQRIAAAQSRNMDVTFGTLQGTIGRFNTTIDKLNSTVDSARLTETFASVQQTSANAARLAATLDSTASRMNALLASVNAGQGTLGMLARDSSMYVEIRNRVKTTDSLLTDFKANPKKYINVRIF
jgi:phospholipid/cholesterol/gamma-HCH transport system substrate-binding protein